MIQVLFLLSCVVVSLGTAQTEEAVNFNGINEFSLRLLDNIAAVQDGNFVVSPLSVWNLFSLLAEGAAGETFQELMLQLNLPKDPVLTRKLFVSADDLLKVNSSQVTLQRSGAMFADKDLALHDDFCELAKNTYKTDFFGVDTSNLTQLAYDINYYICLATEGRIQQTVDAELLQGLRLILIDALYFKAQWTHPFDAKNTRKEAFYDDRGRKVGVVDMMYQKTSLNLAYLDDINADVLELPYGEDKRFSMVILLPSTGSSIKHLLKNLTITSLAPLLETFKADRKVPDVDCYLPRFKVTSKLNLVKPLMYMGLSKMFDANLAEFPGISEQSLYVSTTVQKAEIEVTEEGTTAAAATVVGLEDRILGQRIEVNKPFIYMIVEKSSNILLFVGVYSNPAAE